MPRRKQTDTGRTKASRKPIEQYEHTGETRLNNPPVGLVKPETEPEEGKKTYAYDPHLDPQLVWAGKAEHTSFEVPTVSLHVHERIDPKRILDAVRKRNGQAARGPEQLSMFERPEEQRPLREALDFYKHAHGWSNRLVAGDSLLVMSSLLEKEGMAGKVQMVYIDPPYGIRYGSNFQPFVNRRDVKDGKDEDLTQEPEMIRAFRDTWELGIHSYLAYLRDRLLVTRELLHESGSCFVQISDENLHHVREVLDEVFGEKNFCGLISFRKTSGASSPTARVNVVATVSDYLLWYARSREQVKYRQLYLTKTPGGEGAGQYVWIETDDWKVHPLSASDSLDSGRLLRPDNLASTGYSAALSQAFEYRGETFEPPPNSHWKTTSEGLRRLAASDRIMRIGKRLYYKRFFDDFPVFPITNLWIDTGSSGFAEARVYVVQTNLRVLDRCLLMTTDPGDLVFDPTCGSGTTAFVAEQWGRRWITCDTSRVATALAKQRLMTALYDYYELAHPTEGVGSGFVYKTVPT